MGRLNRWLAALSIVTATGVVLVAVWAYWPTVAGLAEAWSRDPNYSQGFLIPVIALGILWQRCRGLAREGVKPDPWGLAVLLAATALRLAGAYFYATPLDQLSLLVLLAGVCLVIGGRPWLARAWPAIVFLVFMIPIPRSLGGSALVAGLQQVATASSTYALQTFGVMAQQEGNIILLKETELGIVEACSGLRMLTVFCALAAATAILTPYGWQRKTILVGSALPLALACNVIRITAAGLACESLGSEAGHFIFHDLAGWLMVPLAFLLLGAELFLLAKLFQTTGRRAPAVPSARRGPPTRGDAPLAAVAGQR
jgi:exosortase